MIPGSFDELDRAGLERLMANGVAESRTLEYKRELPDPANKDNKREFLADVTSFANALGGDLLFGVDAPKGVPTALPGIVAGDPDAELRRWEDIIQYGVEPRLPGLRLRWIPLEGDRQAMLIRIPPSPVAPHRITFSNWSRFYSRRSNAKYEMDIQELREAFTASEALPIRLKALHLEAVETAVRGELPIGLGDDPKAILSLIPVGYFREARELDIDRNNALAPVKPSGHMAAVEMVEGVLVHTNPGDAGAVRSYAITYRQGRIDVVWTIGGIVHELRKDEARVVWPNAFEDGLRDAAPSGVVRLQPFGIEGPWTIHVSLAGIRDFHLVANHDYWSDPAWRDRVSLPPLRLDAVTPEALLPLFNSFWLAFGLRRPADR